MTALARGEIERFIASPDPRKPLVLIYGPDAGLVAERGAAIAASGGAASNGSFEILKFDGDELAGDPLRLADQANSVRLFSSRQIIRVRVGSKNIAPAIEPLLRAPPLDSLVIFEAGDLKKTAPVRAACEKSTSAAVIACYSDEPADVRRLIEESFRVARISTERDAIDALVALLGGDRLSTRAEIDKLVAYAGDGGRVDLEDVEAVVGDVGATALSEAIDGAFSGDTRAMLPALAKLAASGERPDGILSSALNHAWSLAQGLAQVEAGQPPRTVAERSVPFFRRRPLYERQLQIWRKEGMAPTVRLIGESLLSARAQADMAASLVDRTLLRIAISARKNA